MVCRLLVIYLTSLLIACGGSSGGESNSSSSRSSAAFIFSSVTEADRNEIRSIWAARDLSASDVEIVYQDIQEKYRVIIVRHSVLGKRHYGAIIVPASATTPGSTPVAVMASGLDQMNPWFSVEYFLDFFQTGSSLESFIKVIPTFRGQTLYYKDQIFKAAGDFCDAFDGPTDDSIAMLNVAESLVPQGIYNKVLVTGESRGGNTALLMGIRDERINTVFAAAAPVDFYRQEVLNYYGSQYACQFLTNKTSDESRRLMISSSPLLFEPHPYVENVYLFHGALDENVPRWNVDEMSEQLHTLGVNVQTYVYENQTHNSFYQTPEHLEAFNSGVEQFLQNLNLNP